MCRNGDGDLTVTSACAVPPHAVEGGCLQAGDRDCVAERGGAQLPSMADEEPQPSEQAASTTTAAEGGGGAPPEKRCDTACTGNVD
eukprot:COSAG01_NODE_7421_length_3215_cov_4.074134_1_plen_86_part_00